MNDLWILEEHLNLLSQLLLLLAELLLMTKHWGLVDCITHHTCVVVLALHDAVEQRAIIVLWLQVLVQIDHLYCILLSHDVEESLAMVSSRVDIDSVSVLRIVDTPLEALHKPGSLVPSILVYLACKKIDPLDCNEALLNSFVLENHLDKVLNVGILIVLVELQIVQLLNILELGGLL